MNKQLLNKPFDPNQIKQRPGSHGRTLSYVDVAAVIARLNGVFDHDWSFEVERHEIHEGEVIVLGKLSAGGVTKMAFGGSSVTIDKQGQVVSIADDLKASASDCLKKAASLLGIGLHLYGGAQSTGRARAPKLAAVPPPADRLTTKQLAAIHGVARKHGISKEELAGLVETLAGKTELASLTKSEASLVISDLTGSNGRGR